MRVLVTGADGFAGRHLARHLRARGDEVIAACGPHARTSEGFEARLDVLDAAAVAAVVSKVEPEGIVHLAGFSSVSRSHREPSLAFSVNTVGTVNMLTAIRDFAAAARIVVVSSAEVYGPVESTPVAEDHRCLATSPYAGSKLAAEVAASQFARSYGVDAMVARPFNHLGAGQDPTFVVPSFAAQIRNIQATGAEPILKVGNLEAVRDFLHVEDVVAAYRLLLDRGQRAEVYNIASGQGRSIRSLLEELANLAKLPLRVEVDTERLRPTDIPVLIGSARKLGALGWSPERTVREALLDALAG